MILILFYNLIGSTNIKIKNIQNDSLCNWLTLFLIFLLTHLLKLILDEFNELLQLIEMLLLFLFILLLLEKYFIEAAEFIFMLLSLPSLMLPDLFNIMLKISFNKIFLLRVGKLC